MLIVSAAGAALFASGFAPALAAPNPAGTGQPGASCGSSNASVMPPGFSTDGFANAEVVYAGSNDTSSALHAASDHAVSQYDVACYQLTQAGH
jgi:hypothetical protein